MPILAFPLYRAPYSSTIQAYTLNRTILLRFPVWSLIARRRNFDLLGLYKPYGFRRGPSIFYMLCPHTTELRELWSICSLGGPWIMWYKFFASDRSDVEIHLWSLLQNHHSSTALTHLVACLYIHSWILALQIKYVIYQTPFVHKQWPWRCILSRNLEYDEP